MQLLKYGNAIFGLTLILSSPGLAQQCNYGPETCMSGFVWREASPEDRICVPPATRDLAAADNAAAPTRRDPNAGYGAFGCQQGYVWREAFPNDFVCVTGDTRQQAVIDNGLAADRREPACAVSGTSIQDYVDALPRLTVVHGTPGTLAPATDLVEGLSGQQRSGGRFVNQAEELSLLKIFPDVTWPGALVQGATIANNEFAPIVLPRSPGTIRVTTEFVSQTPVTQSRYLNVISAAEVDDARRQILSAIAASDSVGTHDLQLASAKSSSEAMVKLGIAYKAGSNSASANAAFSSTRSESIVVAKYVQQFYTVSFDPDPNLFSPFFGDAVTLPMVQRFASPSNPPLYVSSITYGRILLMTFKANMSTTDMSAAINAAFSNVSGTLDASTKEKLEAMSVHALAIGSSGELGAEVLTSVIGNSDIVGALRTYITNGAKYTVSNPGSPIAFQMRYLGSIGQTGPFGVAVAQMVTDESPELISMNATEFCRYGFQVWRGQPGGGWRAPDPAIIARPRDIVAIRNTEGGTLSFRVFGAYAGPEGWTDPIPGVLDARFPIGNRPPHSLIGRLGERNNTGIDRTGGASEYNRSSGSGPSDSFYIGDTATVTAGSDEYPNVGRVYIGINDSEAAQLGYPSHKISMDVCVTRSTY